MCATRNIFDDRWRQTRRAFESNNPAASRALHTKICDEPHKVHSIRKTKYTRTIVKSGISGVLGSLATVCSFVTMLFQTNLSNVSPFYSEEFLMKIMLLAGFTLSVANGLINGYAEYLADIEYSASYESERRREEWECDNYIEGEEREMVHLYVSKGIPREDAESVINIFSKHKKFFVDHMMKEELELIQPDETNALANGFLIFLFNALFGTIPLSPFLAFFVWGKGMHTYAMLEPLFNMYNLFLVSVLLSTITLFCLGLFKARFSSTKRWYSGLQLIGNAVFAGMAIWVACSFILRLLSNGDHPFL